MTTIETQETPRGFRVATEGPLAERRAPALVVALECRKLMAAGCRLTLDVDEIVVGRGGPGQPAGDLEAHRIERRPRAARLLVGDFETSRQHLVIRRLAAGWELTDLGSRNGTLVNGERIATAMLAPGDVIEAGGAMLVFVDGRSPESGGGAWFTPADRDLGHEAGGAEAYRTLSFELERRLHQVRKLAPTRVPVLVRGETGTGKELVAREIHEASGRRGPFVAVNCGALPRDLIESELFGHRRGAFSGAAEDREGLIRRADHGTLFLDEIAELPPDSQVALLRVLQDGEVRPVGASSEVKVDVRFVAATHQDLTRRIADGQFRADLYGRISGFEVGLPALRDRREDLGTLIAAILPRICARPELVTLHKPAARALLRYAWPRNIRELEQTLRAAVALSEGREIRLEHLPEAIRDYNPPGTEALDASDSALREQLIALLRQASGNVAAVGRAMDRAPIQIRRWCRRLNIDLAAFRH